MKLISRYWFVSLALLAVVLALSANARSDDSAGMILTASDESQGQATPAPSAANAPSANTQKDNGGLTSPSNPDNGAEESREESAASLTTTNAPNMIGDSNAGGCGAVYFRGVQTLVVQHPIFACSRMNLSENNKAEVQDRVYCTFRHYEGTSLMDIFGFQDPSRIKLFDVNQCMLGFEKKLTDSTSVEVRLPINSQMGNDLKFSDNNGSYSLPFDYETSLGNVGVILKQALLITPKVYLSAGVGVNIPTAPNLKIQGQVTDHRFPVYDPNNPSAPPLAFVDVDNFVLNGEVDNETVNLMPFFALTWTPRENWFVNAFFQIDVPLNPDGVSVSENLQSPDLPQGQNPFHFSGSDTLDEQTLLRVNAGLGRWVYRNESAKYLNGIAMMFEVHYTSTLQDAQIISFNAIPNLGNGATTFNLGNGKNRMDVVNVLLGVPIVMGKTTISNGFVVPVTEERDRGFSFEYALLVDRHF